MATFRCPRCGHDQFHADSHGRDDERQLKVQALTCTDCGQRTPIA